MRIFSALRAGMLALALVGFAASVAPAFAQAHISNGSPYDGAGFHAAVHAAETTGG